MRRIFLLFVVVLFVTGNVFAKNPIDLELELHSNEIYFGDTLYIAVYAKNVSGKQLDKFPAFAMHKGHLGQPARFYYPEFFNNFQINLSHANLNSVFKFYLVYFSKHSYRGSKEVEKENKDTTINYITLNPDERVRIGLILFPLPSLADINDPFWISAFKEPPEANDKFILTIRGTIKKDNITYFDDMVNCRLKINPRSKKSMELISDWYKNSPSIYDVSPEFPSIKFWSKDRSDHYRAVRIPIYWENGKIWEVDPDVSIRYTYTLYPHGSLCPNTWEGWKKLEDTFENGTLRNEICYTRLRIQYYVTNDKKVLEEFKKWLAEITHLEREFIIKCAYQRMLSSAGPGFEKWIADRSKEIYEIMKPFEDKK
jgi:hypothetical protein